MRKLKLDYVEPHAWRTIDEKKFLQSSEWKKLRLKVMEKYDYTCQYCGFRSLKWQIAHHVNHDKGDNRISNISVMCQMCNLIHHSGLGCVLKGVVDLYEKSGYNQKEIVQITRKLRGEGKTDAAIIKRLGLKNKVEWKQDKEYLKNFYGFVTSREPKKLIDMNEKRENGLSLNDEIKALAQNHKINGKRNKL